MTEFTEYLPASGGIQLPPVLESLTGVKFEKLLEQVPALKNAMASAQPKGTAQTSAKPA